MYLLNYILLLSFSFVSIFISLDKKIKNIIYFYLIIMLTIMGCVRDHIGTDYTTYSQIFNSLDSINVNSNIEVGFQFIILFIKHFNSTNVVIFAFIMLISMLFFYKGVFKTSKYPIFSTFIFFSIFYVEYLFNGIRQGLAMCIFLYAITFYYKNDLKCIVLLTFIAMTIHTSGIIIFLGYLLKNIKISNKEKVFILVIGIIVCFINPFEKILFMIPIDYIHDKLTTYTVSGIYEKFTLFNVLQRVLLLIFLILNSKYIKKNDEYLFNIYFFGWIFYVLFSFAPIASTRLNMFFRILEIILIPNVLYGMKSKNKLFNFLIIVLWCSVILISVLRNPYNYPYRMIGIN